MAGTNNYQIWNPSAINQENDAAYTSDSLRASGAPSGAIFPSPTANKLFFQLSVMAYALAQMMANKNYNISDSNATNLTTALTNILTNADVPGYLIRMTDFTCNLAANHGYIKFPTHTPFNGLMLQWGNSSSGSSNVQITFSPAFSAAPYAIFPVTGPGVRDQVYVQTTSGAITASSAWIGTPGSSINIFWLAIGV